MNLQLPLLPSVVALCMLTTAPALPRVSAPILATSCRGGISSIELVEHAAYEATFHNAANVAADDIHVAIPYGRRRVVTFNVEETFAPSADVSVHLHKNLSGGLFAYESNNNTCEVKYVHFVDGTSWGKPNAK